MSKQLRVGVLGFSGYGGAEAVEILRRRPATTAVLLEHRETQAHERPVFDDGLERAPFTASGLAQAAVDVVMLATSAEVSLTAVPLALEAGAKVIDFSGAFRLRTPENHARWYGGEHPRPDLLAEAVYGLPEFHRERIRHARLVANPGCYPTAANLAIRPLVRAGLFDPAAGVVCDAKSGVSGAGRKPSLKTHFCEATENFSAYSVLFHRHVPEVLLNSGLSEEDFSFTAQLLPLHRGILETVYWRSKDQLTFEEIYGSYADTYRNEPFVRLYPEGRLPDLRAIQRTNYCDIGIQCDPKTRRVTVVVAIDNLVKGAAGQAVQNLNLLSGVSESLGLEPSG